MPPRSATRSSACSTTRAHAGQWESAGAMVCGSITDGTLSPRAWKNRTSMRFAARAALPRHGPPEHPAMLDRITPLLLTYNEEANIARTLQRLEWARDVVVVDSLSQDRTARIV